MSIPSTHARPGTASLAGQLVTSVARSGFQTTVSLLALAGASILGGPWAALGAAVAGGGLLGTRTRMGLTPPVETAFSLLIGLDHDGEDIRIDSAQEKGNVLVLGTTGSGKTEGLLGIAEQSIAKGSGVVIIDGKGDVSLFAKMFMIAFSHGREDDLLVLNMMGGYYDDPPRTPGVQVSNTFNPFSTHDASLLTQLVVSMMDETGGDGAMWKGRATALLQALMRVLVWRRDTHGDVLDAGVVRDHLNLRKVLDFIDIEKHPDMPLDIRQGLSSYLSALPGFNQERGYRQAQTTLDQHGYLEMQFTRILSSLDDKYGHIFKAGTSDIDMDDVVANRRILVVLLPAMEKSGDDASNLGKIVVSALKAATQKSGESLTGQDIPPPVFIMDEIGYYMVDGLALAMTRARDRYGAVTIFASNDIPSLVRLNEKEAAAIVAQSSTQIIMKSECENPLADEGIATRDFKPGDMVFRAGERLVFGRTLYVPPNGDKSRIELRSNYLIKLTGDVAGEVA